MFGKTVLSAGVFATLLATTVLAHHPGGTGNTGGAGPINTLSATTLEQGEFAVAFLYEYISLFGLNDAALVGAAANHEHAHSIKTIESAALGAAFGITNDLTVLVRLPYLRRTDIREGEHAHSHGGAVLNTVVARGDASGIGDITTLGQWRFYNNLTTSTEAAVLFGLRFPTGRTDLRDTAGVLFETEFQPGSGSVDKLIGLALTQRFGAWSFDANILHAFAGPGAQQTNLGDRFHYNAAVSYRLIGAELRPQVAAAPTQARPRPHRHDRHSHRHRHDHSHVEATPAKPAPQWRVDLALELNGEWHDKQTVAGERDPNSGGNVVYVSPGLRVGYGSVSGFASVGLPTINEMNGLQSKPGYRVVSGIVAAF